MEVKNASMLDSGLGNDMEDLDEVVFETDVYLSQTLAESLHLFHYPTSNKCFAADEDREYVSARMKLKQKKLEMEIKINTHSDSYDKDRGKLMVHKVDGENTTGEPYFKKGTPFMDKYTLTGTKANISTESYAVGVMKEGELHITPLHTVMELRPSFVHMDLMDKASKKSQNPDEAEAVQEPVAVTVRFEDSNAERQRQIRQRSFQYVQQKNAIERWIDVDIHKLGTSLSQSERNKLIFQIDREVDNRQGSQKDKEVHNESTTSLDYIKQLLPECYRLAGYSKDEVSQVQNPNQDLNLSDQIKQLFINAHVLTLSMLMEKLPANVSKADVLQRVPQFAVLVQGCWAAKSELLYKENSLSPHSGICAKLLINARDYVMWLFTKSKFLTCKEVLKVVYIPDADFKSMVSPMANKAHKHWKFKFDCDEEFLKSHPAVEQSQELKWGLRYQNLVKDLKMRDSEGESPKVSTSFCPRQKSLPRSSISEGEESSMDASGAKAKRQYVAKKRLALSPAKNATKSKMHEPMITSPYLESSPSGNVITELGELVGDALRSHFCMTLSEVKGLVFESHLGSIAARSDFERVLDEALVEYGARKLKNKWPQNTVPESLYAFAKFGNKLDRYRSALLELFSTTARARTNLFVKKVEDELREIISEGDCRQIFEEYCVYKSGFYYLKGTISPDPLH